MQFGLFSAPQWPAGASLDGAIEALVEQVRMARDSGFASVLLGQHMVTGPMQMFQPMPLIARLAEAGAGMRMGPGVLLLGMVNPVMAAEEGATLDWMTGGNFVLAAGLGYRPEEFEAMGVDRRQRAARFSEAVQLIRRLWTEERVTHHGEHFTLNDASLSVRPRQQPCPPIWIGGDVEPAVRRAARLGDAWLAAPTATLARVAELQSVFDAERERLGLTPASTPLIRECFVGRDMRHAREVSRGPLLAKYEAYAAWGQTDTQGRLLDHFERFAAERFIIGDAAAVTDRIVEYRERLGIDHLLLRVQWLGLSQAETLANLERLGQVLARLPGA